MTHRKPYEFEGPAPDAAVYWTSLDDFTLQQSSDPAARDHLAEEIPRTALDFSDGKKTRTCNVSEGTWRKYKDGQHVKAKARASSGELVCSSL